MRWILVIVISMLVLAGCKNTQSAEPILETLTISEECTNMESCCESDCTAFCTDHSQSYDKHMLNGNVCACWCG